MPTQAPHVVIGIEELEQIAALGWRGIEEAQLGSWLLRAAGGFTGRANSALVLGPPPLTENGWLTDLVDWYRQRGLQPRVQVPLPHAAAIEAIFAEAGWQAGDHVHVLTAGIPEVRALAADPRIEIDQVLVHHDREPDEQWLSAYKYRGADLPPHARRVLEGAGPDTDLTFSSLRSDGADGRADVLAVARGALARGWLGITAVTVEETQRRRGLGTHLMVELARWAGQRGGQAIYLQVASDNTAALELYARLGFHHHHDYRYRLAPPVATSAV